MRIYHYNPITGEYRGSSEAAESPLEPGVYLIPRNATTQPPPAEMPGFARRWNGSIWEQAEDHRGLQGWSTSTKSPVAISALGPIPVDFTQVEPPPYASEFGKASQTWRIDDEARAADEAEAQRQEEIRGATERAPAILAATKLLARTAAPTMTDASALALAEVMPEAFPTWTVGQAYAANEVVVHEGRTYRVVQAVTAQEYQRPGSPGMLAIYRPIVLAATGAPDDPIPFVVDMDAEAGKYYSYNGKLYRCDGDLKPAHVGREPGAPGLWQWVLIGPL